MIGEIVVQDLGEVRLLLQVTGCAALGLTGSYLLRHRAARAHQVLLVGLLAAALLPALYILVARFELGALAARPASVPQGAYEQWINEKTSVTEALAAAAITQTSIQPATTEPAASRLTLTVGAGRIPSRRVLLACWAAATALLLGHLVARFALGLRVLVRSSEPESRDLRAAIIAAQTKVGVSRPIRLRCSDRVRSPIIWCWTRAPVLLVHWPFEPRVGAIDWVGIFCHELAHFKRSDHVSALFAELLTVALPWHPLLWWAKWRLMRLSEEACDDWAVADAPTGIDYAESLLALAPEKQLAFLPTVVGKEKTMKTRIRRIVRDTCGNPRAGARWTFLMGMVALLATISVAFAQRPPVRTERREREERVERDENRELARAGRRNVLGRMLEQLTAQARETEAILRERGDGIGQEGHVLRAELDALREHIELVERQLRDLDPDARRRPEADEEQQWMRRAEEVEVRAGELARHREELTEHARQVERELEQLREERPEAGEELEVELREIHERARAVDRELAELGRQQVEGERRTTRATRRQAPQAVEHERALAERLRELQAESAEAGRALRRIEDRDSEEARNLTARMGDLHAEMSHAEAELQESRRRRVDAERSETRVGTRRHRVEPAGSPEEQMIRRTEAQELLRALELELKALHDRGEEHPEASRELRQNIRRMQAELRAAEQSIRAARQPHVGDRLEPGVRAGRGAGWELVHAGLLEHIRLKEEELKSMEDPDGPEASRLRSVLDQLHERRQAIERRVALSGDTLRRPRGIEGEVDQLRGNVSDLREEMAQMRRLLERLLEQREEGEEEGPEVEVLY